MVGFLLRLGLFICSIVLCFNIAALISCMLEIIKFHLPIRKKYKSNYKKRSILTRLLFDFPIQFGKDCAHYDPDTFEPHGIIVFEGEQGAGKTISLVQYANTLKKQYPACKVLSNTKLTFQDDSLDDWHMLTDYKNGKFGVVTVIDECQNYFNSKQSKDFPPEMLSVVTQNRKNRRIILMTAQQFYMLAKDIRTQATELRSAFTVLGCLTFVIRRKPFFDSEGTPVKYKWLGMYFFVQTDELRNSYDTYAVIEGLSKSGFKKKEERLC